MNFTLSELYTVLHAAEAGRDAAELCDKEKSYEPNPYEPGSQLFQAWHMAWNMKLCPDQRPF